MLEYNAAMRMGILWRAIVSDIVDDVPLAISTSHKESHVITSTIIFTIRKLFTS